METEHPVFLRRGPTTNWYSSRRTVILSGRIAAICSAANSADQSKGRKFVSEAVIDMREPALTTISSASWRTIIVTATVQMGEYGSGSSRPSASSIARKHARQSSWRRNFLAHARRITSIRSVSAPVSSPRFTNSGKTRRFANESCPSRLRSYRGLPASRMPVRVVERHAV